MKAAQVAGLMIPVLAAVAVFTDVVLQGLPGLDLDHRIVEDVVNADDPVEAGIEAAFTETRALLSIDGVDGVNVFGLASGAGTRIGARVKAEVSARIRAGATA
jgi:methylenetetrahydrofolate reductase (NADPH)